MSPAALLSVASPQRFLFLRLLAPSPDGSSAAEELVKFCDHGVSELTSYGTATTLEASVRTSTRTLVSVAIVLR
jgi:hypothetical protein